MNAPSCPPLSITTSSDLPAGTVGQAYSIQLQHSGGVAPINYSLAAGALPNGLNMSINGLITGTPTTAGNFSFTVEAVDSCNSPDEQVVQ